MRALRGMDGWVYEKNNMTAIMEIMKDRFVLCRVMSCVVLYHVGCVCAARA